MENVGGNQMREKESHQESPLESVVREICREDPEELRKIIKRIDIPGFDGSDPLGWLRKADQYFAFHGTTPKLLTSVWKVPPCIGINGLPRNSRLSAGNNSLKN